VVAPDGRIAQLVLEGASARHAGNLDYNRRSIGVELATRTRDRKGALVPAEQAFPYSLLWPAAQLVADILRRHNLPPSREVVIGHDQVPDPLDPSRLGGRSHHTDPGPAFGWAEFMDDVEKLLTTPKEIA
jgi:N-acetyl-anhydromuramyl-L-alanine amidase AmpD